MQHFQYNYTINAQKTGHKATETRYINLNNISEAWVTKATYSEARLPTPRLKCLFNSKKTIICGWWRCYMRDSHTIWLTRNSSGFQSQGACKFNQLTVKTWKKHFIISFEWLSKVIIAGVANRQGGVRLQALRMCCFLKPDSCMLLIPALAVECTSICIRSSQISSSSNDCKYWPSFPIVVLPIYQAVILCNPTYPRLTPYTSI